MKKTIIGLMFLIVFMAGCATVSKEAPEVSDVIWPDYRKPLSQEMNVFQYGRHKIQSATITVDLPEDFLNKHEEIILIVDLESRTKGGFEVFAPFVRINRSTLFKTSGISVRDLPYRQIVESKIKREHLKAGQNTLQPTFRWKGNYYCSGIGCGYVIHKVSFKDAPPLLYTLEISSNPSGAKVFLERKYKGTTPLKIPDLRKQTYRIRIEKDGYEPIEDKIVLTTDSARIYDLSPK
jgi:hypothetical protein